MTTLAAASWGDEGIWVAGEWPKTFTAGAAIYKGQIVTLGASGVTPASESELPFGVATQTVASGDDVAVAIDGAIVYVLADATGITAGHLVGSTTVDTEEGHATDLGTIAPSALTVHPIGIALEDISANATGKIVLLH